MIEIQIEIEIDREMKVNRDAPELVGREGVDVSARLDRQGAGDELDVAPFHIGDDHDAHLNDKTT